MNASRVNNFHSSLDTKVISDGVVTEAIIKIRPVPEVQQFDSIIFPNFELGVKFMEEMSKQKTYPTSLRLVDNQQFAFS